MTKPLVSTPKMDLDFTNTEIAFAGKSDTELSKAVFLFRTMNYPLLVKIGGPLTILAVKWRLPGFEWLLRNTLYEQFCGGRTLLESNASIDHLRKHKTFSILDYGAEAKETESDFNITMNETIRAIEFASTNVGIPIVSCKITGLSRFGLLEKANEKAVFTPEEEKEWTNLLKRMDAICNIAEKKSMAVFFDAEESWIQDAIDGLVMRMMRRYNKEKVVVYNTFQMYRHDRLAYLIASYQEAKKDGFILGAKLVRGAYMEKERKRAAEKGYASPIQLSKEATDVDFDKGIAFCVEHLEGVAVCNASHNQESARKMAELIVSNGHPKNHKHLLFSQLYGMSDHLTFNLAEAGFNVAKYLVYGPVADVVPYLVRRAQENTSVTGEASRELSLLLQEKKRRKTAK